MTREYTMEVTEGNVKRRSFSHVAWQVAEDIVYFLAPMMLADTVARGLKPLLMDPEDLRGPWECLWHKILSMIGTDDPYYLYVYATFTLTYFMYWFVSALYGILDFTQRPKFLHKYKTQPGTNETPNLREVVKVVLVVHFNLFLSFLFNWGVSPIVIAKAKSVYHVPSPTAFYGYMVTAMVGFDIWFYHSHRLLHSKYFYKRVHKTHHEWTSPIAASAAYSNPIEHLMAGIPGPSVGVMLTNMPLPVMWVWFTWIIVHSLSDHSGYNFPVIVQQEMHDIHHIRFHTCYGWLPFWDWLYSTDTTIEDSPDIRLNTLKSVRGAVPDYDSPGGKKGE